MSDKDSISVIIPAYNIEKYIGRAIDNALSQSLLPDEIIVVDDGSTDGTAEIVKRYGSKVRYIYQDNAGLSAARNAAIKASGCEWIALLDGDDHWLPEKLECQMQLLANNRNLVWTTSNYLVHYCDNGEEKIFVDAAKIDKFLINNSYFESCFEAINVAGLAPVTMIINRHVFEEVGVFEHGLPYAEDIDMYWKIAYRWPKIGYVNKPLAVYFAQRPGSLTSKTSPVKILSTLSDIFERHLELAEGYDKKEDILPFVLQRLRKWIHAAYRNKEFDITRQTIFRFGEILPIGYKILMNFLTILPKCSTRVGKIVLKLLKCNS